MFLNNLYIYTFNYARRCAHFFQVSKKWAVVFSYPYNSFLKSHLRGSPYFFKYHYGELSQIDPVYPRVDPHNYSY